MLGVPLFDTDRMSASQCARCPICFEALHTRPHDVGALVLGGKRIEPTLYHKSCMTDENGSLRLSASLTPPWYRSPMSRQPCDGFALLPSIRKKASWAKFVDWNNDGAVSVAELAAVIAAMLPIDDSEAEKFVSKHFDKLGKGEVESEQIMHEVLPFLHKNTGRIVLGRQSAEIYSSSTGQNFLSWFDHVDKTRCGHVTVSCMRMALIASLKKGDAKLKQMVANSMLADAGLLEIGLITKVMFLEHLVPLLQLNLPSKESKCSAKEDSQPFDVKGSLSIKFLSATGQSRRAEVPGSGTVSDLRNAARRQFRIWLAGRDARLCLAGKFIEDDAASLSSLPDLYGNSVVQVLPMVRVYVPRSKAIKVSASGSSSSDSDSDSEYSAITCCDDNECSCSESCPSTCSSPRPCHRA